MHVYVGDMDNHYLNLAVYLMEQEASKLKNPEANFTFEYGRPMKPHGWRRPHFLLRGLRFRRKLTDH